MNEFKTPDLQALLQRNQQDGIRVSIYTPTHRTGRDVREDPIHLKNAIRDAEKKLSELDVDSAIVHRILKPANDLLRDENGDFWEHNLDTLALFLADGESFHYRLPVHVQPIVSVSRNFHIKPLLETTQHDQQFYILAVSQAQVRFFRGSKHHVELLEPETLPSSLQDALKIDEYQDTLQFHSHRRGASTDTSESVFHGHGAGNEADRKTEILQFFHRLDKAVSDFLADRSAPLIFAGVEYLFPIYKETNNYRFLLDQPLTGNPDAKKSETLKQEAWKLISRRVAEEMDNLQEKFGAAAAHDLASDDLDQVLKAASEGRVDTLILARGEHVWGRFDSQQTQRLEASDVAAEDLTDRAAVLTISNSGRVIVSDGEAVPGNGPVAAIFRYSSASTT